MSVDLNEFNIRFIKANDEKTISELTVNFEVIDMIEESNKLIRQDLNNSTKIEKDDELVFLYYSEDKVMFKYKLFNLKKFIMQYRESKNVNLSGNYIEDTNDLFEYLQNENKILDSFCATCSFFEKKVSARYLSFEKDCIFMRTVFKEGVDFWSVTFAGEVCFRESTFAGDADFQFSIFKKDVDFGVARFEENANFISTTFEEKAYFRVATFASSGYFRSATFARETNFEIATFNSQADFTSAIFNSYINLIMEKCLELFLDGSINRGIIDLKSNRETKVNIKEISFVDMKNLGQIRIDRQWSSNKLQEMIEGNYQEKTYNNYIKIVDQYRTLKENFHNLGQYEDEDKAYVELKRAERKGALKNPDIKWYQKVWRYFSNPFKYIMFDLIGGYGTKPRNVFITMMATVLLFAVLFSFIPGTMVPKNPDGSLDLPFQGNKFLTATYHSIVTFLTIGYGNISPQNWLGVLLSGVEGFIGLFLMSYFTVAFVRKILR